MLCHRFKIPLELRSHFGSSCPAFIFRTGWSSPPPVSHDADAASAGHGSAACGTAGLAEVRISEQIQALELADCRHPEAQQEGCIVRIASYKYEPCQAAASGAGFCSRLSGRLQQPRVDADAAAAAARRRE